MVDAFELVDGSSVCEIHSVNDMVLSIKERWANGMCHEQKEARHGVVRDGQGSGSTGENRSRIVERTLNVNNGSLEAIEVHDVSEIPQQQPRGTMIRWERFLPFRTIKVLLVENEDLTRHLVSAVLQNCSYEGEYWCLFHWYVEFLRLELLKSVAVVSLSFR